VKRTLRDRIGEDLKRLRNNPYPDKPHLEVVGILPRGLVLRKLRRLEEQAEGAVKTVFVYSMTCGGSMSWR